MVDTNYDACLAFVWRAGFDSPADRMHATKNDPGGNTNGGVTQAVWDACCKVGAVKGALAEASPNQLSAVLRLTCWSPVCAALPAGLDLLLFNGKMLTGYYNHLVQQGVGLTGSGVDGWIGPQTISRILLADPVTLIDAVTGSHYAYLSRLPIWPNFGAGWTKRLLAAQSEAIEMVTRSRP